MPAPTTWKDLSDDELLNKLVNGCDVDASWASIMVANRTDPPYQLAIETHLKAERPPTFRTARPPRDEIDGDVTYWRFLSALSQDDGTDK